jgi:hypothetical protein
MVIEYEYLIKMEESKGIEPLRLLHPTVFKRPRPQGASWGQEDSLLVRAARFP